MTSGQSAGVTAMGDAAQQGAIGGANMAIQHPGPRPDPTPAPPPPIELPPRPDPMPTPGPPMPRPL
jgi:hypothetical protein